MEVRIIRGENQIGGNIIEISTTSTKILLDVGLELDKEKYDELPNIAGLFDFKGYDAIFISHYHSDHLGLAYNVHPDIPVYIGESSYKIIRASDEYKHIKTITPAGFMKHRKTIQIGDISVTAILCDHSAFDSYMLLCESKGKRVLYTGDFRLSGRKPMDWLLKQLPKNVDILICEGTTLSRCNYNAATEEELESQAVALFRECDGPIFILQSSMNIDRIVTMYKAAKKTGRVFLQELYMADITSAIGGSIPNPSFKDVYTFITNPSRYDGLMKYKNRVGKDFITKRPFVMCVRTSMIRYMQSLAEEMDFNKGLLIYSFWSGYKEMPVMKLFLEDCQKLGLTIKTLHTGGHADKEAIEMIIELINPKVIMPVHTEFPEWFAHTNSNGGIKNV